MVVRKRAFFMAAPARLLDATSANLLFCAHPVKLPPTMLLLQNNNKRKDSWSLVHISRLQYTF